MKPATLRRVLAAALLAAPLLASPGRAQTEADIRAALARSKAASKAQGQAPVADTPSSPSAIRLPNGWDGGRTTATKWRDTLDVPTWVVDCDHGAPDCKEKGPLYWYPKGNDGAGAWMNFFDYQTTVKPGFAPPSGFPKFGGTDRIEVYVAPDAQKVMDAQGLKVTDKFLRNAANPKYDLNLNSDGLTKSVKIEVDPNNSAALIVTAANKDGTKSTARLVRGVLVP